MKKRKENGLERLLSITIIVIMLPLLVTVIWQSMESERLLGLMAEPQTTEEVAEPEQGESGQADSEQVESGQVEAEQVEALLPGIVAKEMETDAPVEALKAQCVIARTNVYLARESGKSDPEGFTTAQMKEIFGETEYQEQYQQLEQMVHSTKNQVLTWQDDYIDAEYHAISAGMTRSIVEAAPQADFPYLTQVLCKPDLSARRYLSVHYWKEKDFLKKCKETFPEAGWEEGEEVHINQEDVQNQLRILTRDAGDYVLTIQVAGQELSGEEFRKKMGLNSACFSIEEEEGTVRIVTKGLGHGYGLSQNTAIQMARDGESYQDILMYFFPGTQLMDCIK